MYRAILVLSLAACNESRLVPDPVDPDPGTDPDLDTDTPVDPDPGTVNDADGDGSPVDLDCDDTDPAVFPGAPDICGDDAVTDCDRTSDDGLVTLDGSQSWDGDLQAALRDAAPNAEIRVCPGAYAGPFTGPVPVRIVAQGDATDTILDGLGQGPTLTVSAGTELVGLTIIGGDGQKGGGLELSSEGTLLVEACAVTGNHARYGGGLATGQRSTVTLVDTEVRGNDASWNGGGALVEAGSVLDLSVGSVISANFADQGGGGVSIENGSLVGGTVSGNETNVFGGGIQVLEGTVEDTVVDGNVGGTGGGVYVEGAVVLRDLTVTANEGGFGGGGIGGGAFLIYVENTLTLEGGAITANQAETYGGGLYAVSPASIDGTEITDNTAQSGAGVWTSGPVTMSGGSLLRNVASRQGGGVFIRSSGPDDALFAAEGVDLGSAADDNTPVDVTTGRDGAAEYVGYGASTTLSCDETVCVPAP